MQTETINDRFKSRYSLGLCVDVGLWAVCLVREFYWLGIAVVAIGPLRVIVTWPVLLPEPGTA